MTTPINYNEILNNFKKLYKSRSNPLHEPYFDDSDCQSVKNCIKSSFVSTYGVNTQKLEKQICHYTGSKYAVCTSSGTAALHTSLLLSNIDKNSEVLLPSFNFIASANAIRYCDAIPHFIDVSQKNMSIEPEYLNNYLSKIIKKKNKFSFNKQTGRKISALILPHLFGLAGDAKKIYKILNHFRIELIEDAAEGMGVFIKNKHVGTIGKFGILSFNGNKIITTGGGGAILTQNYKDYLLAKQLITTNKKNHKWKYNFYDVGYNYRMPALNASLGISQIRKLNKLIKKKKEKYIELKKFFQNHKYLKVKEIPKGTKSNYWLINLEVDKKINVNFLLKQLNSSGIYARQAWCLLHQLEHFKNYPKARLENTKQLFKKIISIPSSVRL